MVRPSNPKSSQRGPIQEKPLQLIAALANQELPLTLGDAWSYGQHRSHLRDHHAASLGSERLEILDIPSAHRPSRRCSGHDDDSDRGAAPGLVPEGSCRRSRGSGNSVTTPQPLRRLLEEASEPTCPVSTTTTEGTMGGHSPERRSVISRAAALAEACRARGRGGCMRATAGRKTGTLR